MPLRQHRVFWFWGTAALLGSMVFPAVFIAAGEPLVELLVEKSFNPQAPSWGLLLVSGPVLLIVLFAAAFWAIRLFKGVAYLARYKIAPVPAVALGVSRASTAQPRRPPLSPSGVEGPVQLQPLRPATTAPTRRQTLS